jgi:ribosomal protein L33
MTFNEINKNIDKQMRILAKKEIKKQIGDAIIDLACKNCGERSYTIQSYTDTFGSIIAHLKCDSCGFVDNFVSKYSLNTEDAKKEIQESIKSLQDAIKDFNSKARR